MTAAHLCGVAVIAPANSHSLILQEVLHPAGGLPVELHIGHLQQHGQGQARAKEQLVSLPGGSYASPMSHVQVGAELDFYTAALTADAMIPAALMSQRQTGRCWEQAEPLTLPSREIRV